MALVPFHENRRSCIHSIPIREHLAAHLCRVCGYPSFRRHEHRDEFAAIRDGDASSLFATRSSNRVRWVLASNVPTDSMIASARIRVIKYELFASEKESDINTPDWIRTSNLRFRRPMLYPVELRVRRNLVAGSS